MWKESKYPDNKKEGEEKWGGRDMRRDLTINYGKWNLNASSRYRKDGKGRGSQTMVAEKAQEQKGEEKEIMKKDLKEIIREND